MSLSEAKTNERNRRTRNDTVETVNVVNVTDVAIVNESKDEMNIRTKAIIGWLTYRFAVEKVNRNLEVNFKCPMCDHPAFSFNAKKRIGHCFRAGCQYSPTLEDLIMIIGSGPEDYDSFRVGENLESPAAQPSAVSLPPDTKPILFRDELSGQLFCNDTEAYSYALSRNIDQYSMLRFDFFSDRDRVYVPITDQGIIVNYVGRLKPSRSDTGKLRYKYAPGVKTNNYIFGWDECTLWPELTLVENTFNSIWLRNHINCSTNFGSHLSDRQIELIASSKAIKTVLLLWDEGAEISAQKAVKRLRNAGIASCLARIKGQPDNHSLETLVELATLGHKAAKVGKESI